MRPGCKTLPSSEPETCRKLDKMTTWVLARQVLDKSTLTTNAEPAGRRIGRFIPAKKAGHRLPGLQKRCWRTRTGSWCSQAAETRGSTPAGRPAPMACSVSTPVVFSPQPPKRLLLGPRRRKALWQHGPAKTSAHANITPAAAVFVLPGSSWPPGGCRYRESSPSEGPASAGFARYDRRRSDSNATKVRESERVRARICMSSQPTGTKGLCGGVQSLLASHSMIGGGQTAAKQRGE